MQSAYAEYRRTSEVLECTRHTGDESDDDRLRLTMMEGQQRLAFELYMDARIAFLESRFDALYCAQAGIPAEAAGTPEQPKASRVAGWLWLVSEKPLLQSLAIVLLCTTAYSLIAEQKRVQKVELGLGEIRAAILHTAQQVQSLDRRLESAGSSPSERTSGIPSARAPRKPVLPKKPMQNMSTARAQPGSSKPAEGNRNGQTDSSKPGFRTASAFSLSPSRQFRRVGRLSVMLKSILSKSRAADLVIMTDTARTETLRITLNQPVWVRTITHERVGLVVTRITASHVEGHVLEPMISKAEVRTSQFRPNAGSPR